MAEALGAAPALSTHPAHGPRQEPDARIADAHESLDTDGRTPSRWAGEELASFAETQLDRSPALMGFGDANGFTVEFPYGAETSSLCEVAADQTHPWYGRGLALRQRFPISVTSSTDGWRLALELNALAPSEAPLGYGFGSFGYEQGTFAFQSFFPNLLHRRGLIMNLYLSCAERARMLSMRLTGVEWTAASLDRGRSGLARAMGQGSVS